MVDVTVDSENYMQIRPEEMHLYRRGDPNQILMTLSLNKLEHKLAHKHVTSGDITLGAMATLSLTNGDIVKIMDKIEKLVMESPEGMSHKLNEIFSDEKLKTKRFLTPGTLRIYANNMACYYTGRSWRKIRLTRGEN